MGYPQQWIDFSPIVIRPDDHFGNVQRASDFQQRRELAKLGQPVVAERFANPRATTPTAVNAAYNPQTNSIDITAAIVQPPFYVPTADAAVNYCTIGAVHRPRADARLRQQWAAATGRPATCATGGRRRPRPSSRSAPTCWCSSTASSTLLPGLKHNGALTLTENTADLGGITLAHAALHRSLAGKPQPKIDGLSTDQRCFVAWAQMWAYKARAERVRSWPPSTTTRNTVVRGYAPLLHLDAFHQAFGTRPGDAMWRAAEGPGASSGSPPFLDCGLDGRGRVEDHSRVPTATRACRSAPA